MTRRLVTCAVALSLATGCFMPGSWSKDLHRRAYQSDAALVIGGLVLAALPCRNSPDSDIDCHTMLVAMGAAAAVPGVLGALLNLAVGDGGPDAAADDAPAPAPIGARPPGETPSTIAVPPHEGALGQLAREAALAARTGDCVGTRASMRAIFRADDAYYQQVVASEPAIVICLR